MAGVESDPIWAADQSQFLPVDDAYAIFQTIIPAETYMTKSGDDTITGVKTFSNGTFAIANSAGDGYTLFSSLAGSGVGTGVSAPNKTGVMTLTSDIYKMARYSVYTSGNTYVEVLADSLGVTASLTSNELKFAIPENVKLISAKIRLTSGFSTLKIFTGTTDMGNTSATNRWMPLVQAWREDTGQQLTGMTVTMDLSVFDKFTVNGLISSTNNLIRINF
jgi:hypothetical protein